MCSSIKKESTFSVYHVQKKCIGIWEGGNDERLTNFVLTFELINADTFCHKFVDLAFNNSGDEVILSLTLMTESSIFRREEILSSLHHCGAISVKTNQPLSFSSFC